MSKIPFGICGIRRWLRISVSGNIQNLCYLPPLGDSTLKNMDINGFGFSCLCKLKTCDLDVGISVAVDPILWRHALFRYQVTMELRQEGRTSFVTVMTPQQITRPWQQLHGVCWLFWFFIGFELWHSFYNGRECEVEPTRISWSVYDKLKPASERAWRTGTLVRSTRSRSQIVQGGTVKESHHSSDEWRSWFGVEVTPERSFFAFKRVNETLKRRLSVDGSRYRFSCLNSATKWSMIFWSKSSPPSLLSSCSCQYFKTPSPSSRIDASNVPPGVE